MIKAYSIFTIFNYIRDVPRLIKQNAQDAADIHQQKTYPHHSARLVSFGVISFLVTLTLFYSHSSSASMLVPPVDSSLNSQRVALLSPDYSVEIPKAIGGAVAPRVDNRLALLSPQVGIISGSSRIKDIEVNDDGIVVYEVQKGDTLSELAESFDVSMNTIKWENNLSGSIHPGQELRILPVTGIRHTIQKGDTFGSIAKKYDVEIEDITIFNDIDATKLIPGKKIMIPNGVKTKARSKIIRSHKKSISAPVDSGYYIRPTSGVTTSLFGPRKLMSHSYHYGIDFGGKIGTPYYAAASGTVVKVVTSCVKNFATKRCGGGYGNHIIIQHDNGTRSLYAHSNYGSITVAKGSKVSQGQHIGNIGATGNITGPHLHFEIIESNGQKRNVNFLK